MALRTLGARTFKARTFKPVTFAVLVLVRRKNYGIGGGGPDPSDESKYQQLFNYDYELVNLRDRLLREDEEILAVIVAATQILLR